MKNKSQFYVLTSSYTNVHAIMITRTASVTATVVVISASTVHVLVYLSNQRVTVSVKNLQKLFCLSSVICKKTEAYATTTAFFSIEFFHLIWVHHLARQKVSFTSSPPLACIVTVIRTWAMLMNHTVPMAVTRASGFSLKNQFKIIQ